MPLRDEPQLQDFEDFDASSAMPQSLHAYSSPLLRRMVQQGLTLTFLAAQTPIFHAGEAATLRLADTDQPVADSERDALLRIVADGVTAKEALVSAAIPLVRLLANKEFDRKGGTQGKIRSTRDELFQEGIIGLFAGLRKYDASGNQHSPTNYLGAWITVTMRRNSDSAEHDFALGYVVAERFRRIHAIRSRLQGELGRPPSDDEIITAWTDPTYLASRMMGRVNQGDKVSKSVVTIKQLNDERKYAGRMGVKAMPIDEDGGSHAYNGATALETSNHGNHEDEYADAKRFLAELLEKTLDLLRVAPGQRHVISLKFGLDGFDEHPHAGIMAATRLSRSNVTAILDAFTKEMTRKHGAFHKVCAEVDYEDLLSCGLTWVSKVLGEYTPAPITPPETLTVPMATTGGKPPPPPMRANEKPGQIRAQFQCPTHKTGFVGAYRDMGDVPAHRACPRCGEASPVIRVLET